MQHLVEEGRTLRSEAARLGPARRDLRRIEEGLWTAAGTGEEASGLSRKVKAGHFVADVDGQLLAEHGAQHRGAERSADLAPELDLALRHAKELPRQRALHRREIERERRPQAGAH